MPPNSRPNTDYLRQTAKRLAGIKHVTYRRMNLPVGGRALDVGSGPATDTIALSAQVGSSGLVVGVDTDHDMVAYALRQAEQAGVSSWTRHLQADAANLPFPSSSFDAVRSERAFQHMLEPERALAEMMRVVRPGGWVVVLDTDWGTLSLDTPFIDLERRLARVKAEHCLRNGYSGRRLRGLFAKSGLQELLFSAFTVTEFNYAYVRDMIQLDLVESEALRLGIATQTELELWREALQQASAEGRFYGSLTLTLAAGQKPRE